MLPGSYRLTLLSHAWVPGHDKIVAVIWGKCGKFWLHRDSCKHYVVYADQLTMLRSCINAEMHQHGPTNSYILLRRCTIVVVSAAS